MNLSLLIRLAQAPIATKAPAPLPLESIEWESVSPVPADQSHSIGTANRFRYEGISVACLGCRIPWA